MSNQMQTTGGFSLAPQNLNEAMQLADLMSQSEMVPKDYRGKPANVLIAVQMGAELGLKPVQSLQNIAVINGRPSIWGDGLRALIMSSPDLVSIDDSFDDKTMTATCTIIRNINGQKNTFTDSFSQKDAELAGLWGRNTWKAYPKKMLEWRAFGFASRRAFADRLRGLWTAEESRDIPIDQQEIEVNPQPSEPEFYPDDKFSKNFPTWQALIESNKKTADQIIKTIESKSALTDEQIQKIKDCGEKENASD